MSSLARIVDPGDDAYGENPLKKAKQHGLKQSPYAHRRPERNKAEDEGPSMCHSRHAGRFQSPDLEFLVCWHGKSLR